MKNPTYEHINPFPKKGDRMRIDSFPLIVSTGMLKNMAKFSDEELKLFNIDPKEVKRLNKKFN